MNDPETKEKRESSDGSKSRRPGNKSSDTSPGSENWRYWAWYAAFTLLVLWTWQEAFRSVSIRTIPYSEFKERLARGEVTECHIGQDDIVGKYVVPKESESETGKKADEAPTKDAKPSKEAKQEEIAPREAEATTADNTSTDVDAKASKADTREDEKQQVSEPAATSEGQEPNTEEIHFRTVRVEDPDLIQELEKKRIQFEGVRPGFLSNLLWSWIVPIGVMFLIWIILIRRMAGAGQSVLSFTRSKARIVADEDTGVTFADVAGCDEAKFELQEIVDFLMNPKRYEALGAKIPKGALLVGPPGTGKTLLGRAVAGEAKVPFFSLSGSDFVEMFVGVGAARVRDLFQQAKSHAPCIIFLDELDAIGRQRGVHVGAVNDEREQTLNQLLVEMDGFAPNTGVILLAATNRPEVLDRALLRPGRFDRQIVVDAPDIDGREAVLKVHARDKRMAGDINLRRIAQATAGFSGADLANLLNEAALLAVRNGQNAIQQKEIEEAIEKVVAGPERKSRRLADDEKKRVAYHEIGHALVGAHCKNSDPLHKITIVPRGRAALGYTLHLPADQQFLMTQAELSDRIKMMLGGRAAEEVALGEVSTGAENDLERATDMARQMISMFGMGESVGLAHVARRPAQFLPTDGANQLDCSPETAREVDLEVKKILDEAYRASKQILVECHKQLDDAAGELLVKETIDAETFYQIIGMTPHAGKKHLPEA